jgi:hypothetical protein
MQQSGLLTFNRRLLNQQMGRFGHLTGCEFYRLA